MNLALPFTVGKSAPTKKLIFDKGLQLKSISDKELEFITKKVLQFNLNERDSFQLNSRDLKWAFLHKFRNAHMWCHSDFLELMIFTSTEDVTLFSCQTFQSQLDTIAKCAFCTLVQYVLGKQILSQSYWNYKKIL